MSFRKGDMVKVKAVIPQGPILAMRMDEDGNVFCLLEWVDDSGNTTQRWFAEDILTTA